MIGRGLVGEVERDLEVRAAARPRRTDRNPSSVPSPGSIAVWPPASEPIAHGLPGSSGPRLQRVVPALAKAAADRMDRREVQHVEPHGLDVRQQRGGLVECRAALRIRAGGARKHLVPRAEPRPFAFNRDAENPVVPRRAAAIGRRGHRIGQVGRQRRGHALADRSSGVRQATPQSLRAHRLSAGCPRPGFLPRAARSTHPARLRSSSESPCRQLANLSIQPSTVYSYAAERIDDELRLPAIVPERRHRRFAPGVRPRPVQQRRGEHIVPVRKHVRASRPPVRPTVRLIGNRPSSTDGRTFSITTRRWS